VNSEFVTWQLVDSAFPTGAFAHSWGLEAAWQHGEIGDVAALRRFVEAAVQQTAHGVVPFVNAAYRAPDRWPELDELADAFLTNTVANRVSRQQGRTLLTTAARVWPATDLVQLKAVSAGLCAHFAPVAGAVFRRIGLSLPTSRRIVLFSAARSVLSAAVRLGVVGSYEAQGLQLESAPFLEAQSERCADFDEHDIALVAPIPDLLQAAHDRLYSRLFQG
jgi:urease accessory protein